VLCCVLCVLDAACSCVPGSRNPESISLKLLERNLTDFHFFLLPHVQLSSAQLSSAQHSTAAQHTAQHRTQHPYDESWESSTQHTAHSTQLTELQYPIVYSAVITDTLSRVTLSGRTKAEQQPHRIQWRGFLASAGDSLTCRFRAM
jgi:hypothetical protein